MSSTVSSRIGSVKKLRLQVKAAWSRALPFAVATCISARALRTDIDLNFGDNNL